MIKKMEETINLGESIELTGSKELDKGVVVILKKMIGNYVKKINEKKQYNELLVTLKVEDKEFSISVICDCGEEKLSGSKTDKNLFFAIDGALQEILRQG